MKSIATLVNEHKRRRLSAIDRLIDGRFMPKRCLPRVRGACRCGHVKGIHRDGKSLCGGRAGRNDPGWKDAWGRKWCACGRFVPKSYVREQAALRKKLRAFALDVLREVGDGC